CATMTNCGARPRIPCWRENSCCVRRCWKASKRRKRLCEFVGWVEPLIRLSARALGRIGGETHHHATRESMMGFVEKTCLKTRFFGSTHPTVSARAEKRLRRTSGDQQ